MVALQQTFAASVSAIPARFKNAISEDREFIQFEGDSLTSEALVNDLYEIYFALCADGFYDPRGKTEMGDIGAGYLNAIYVPCTDRVVFSGQVDLLNDEVPEFSSLALPKNDHEEISFCFVQKVNKLPRGVSGIPFATHVRSTILFKGDEDDRESRRASKWLGAKAPLQALTTHFSITKSGMAVPCRDATEWNVRQLEAVRAYGVFAQDTCAAINATTDKRFLWLVSTEEETISSAKKTKLELGVSPEQVKSLFYSRSLPVTETGRKRPILHWVRSHQRRIKEGIDIDIEKHLRGMERFDMGGFKFEITQPVKKPKP